MAERQPTGNNCHVTRTVKTQCTHSHNSSDHTRHDLLAAPPWPIAMRPARRPCAPTSAVARGCTECATCTPSSSASRPRHASSRRSSDRWTSGSGRTTRRRLPPEPDPSSARDRSVRPATASADHWQRPHDARPRRALLGSAPGTADTVAPEPRSAGGPEPRTAPTAGDPEDAGRRRLGGSRRGRRREPAASRSRQRQPRRASTTVTGDRAPAPSGNEPSLEPAPTSRTVVRLAIAGEPDRRHDPDDSSRARG